MPAALRASCTSDTMKSEQNVYKTEKEGHDSIDSFIRQAIGKEPFFPFAKASESPVQWIQLLHALDQQGTNNFPNVAKVDNAIEGKEQSPEHSNGVPSFAYEKNGFKESTHAMRAGGLAVKGTKSTSEHIQSLKIPEAVVALAQAAAKANDSEKCMWKQKISLRPLNIDKVFKTIFLKHYILRCTSLGDYKALLLSSKFVPGIYIIAPGLQAMLLSKHWLQH
ncbi:hypothetical protein ACLOJK_024434 [Asimina triloba]